jgi:hypothetical protein
MSGAQCAGRDNLKPIWHAMARAERVYDARYRRGEFQQPLADVVTTRLRSRLVSHRSP